MLLMISSFSFIHHIAWLSLNNNFVLGARFSEILPKQGELVANHSQEAVASLKIIKVTLWLKMDNVAYLLTDIMPCQMHE